MKISQISRLVQAHTYTIQRNSGFLVQEGLEKKV
jgi:hypothetical protein